jgi:50S ribosomal protein L16 3-hydroxylase
MLEQFRFIPDWRVDDVMISFAPRAGTVGPHVDSYDVFLIQGLGRRRWRIDSKAPTELRKGFDLRLLKKFQAEADWILEPGDMLYLPPNLAHYRTALEECLTYSIGFRSPCSMDLLAAAQQKLIQMEVPSKRYRDPNLTIPKHAGEIPRSAIQELRRLMEEGLKQLSPKDFDDLLGELLTEPKGEIASSQQPVSASQLKSKFRQGASFMRTPGVRVGFVRQGESIILYSNGQKHVLSPQLSFAAILLSGEKQLGAHQLHPHLTKKGFLELLSQLIQGGGFYLEK